jgi:hypothetical protein
VRAQGADVQSLGRIVFDRPSYHSPKYLWPVGYRSVRRMADWNDPAGSVLYTSEIVDNGAAPLFRVAHPDGTTVQATACSTVWKVRVRACVRVISLSLRSSRWRRSKASQCR